MGNIFATHMYDKGIVSRIKQTVKATDSPIKKVQNIWTNILKKEYSHGL